MIWVYITLALALLLSAIVSGSETALLSVNKLRISELAKRGNRRAKLLQKVLARPEDMFSVILLLNNVFNVLIATLVGVLVADWLGGGLAAVVVATAVTTVVVVMLSELTPKTIAVAVADGWSLAAAPFFRGAIIVLRPIVAAMGLLPRAIIKLLRIDGRAAERPSITPGELRHLVDLSEEEGHLEEEQGDIIKNTFRFGVKTVADIMTPRVEIIALNADVTLEQFLASYKEQPRFVFPVLGGASQDMEGIIYVQDVLELIAGKGLRKDARLDKVVGKPLFVPEVTALDEVFEMMRDQRQRAVLAVDEFGAVSGVVTLSQLTEWLVGYGDENQRRIDRLPDGGYLVDGATPIETLVERVEWLDHLTSTAYDTVAGWFLSVHGDIPSAGNVVTDGGVRLTVREMAGGRIARVALQRI